MLKKSGLCCAVLVLAGCVTTPAPKDYGKDVRDLRQRVEALETEVALMKATPKDDPYACPPEVDCD